MHLHHIDDEEKYCFKNETISTDNLFSLFQKSDGTLIMRNSIDGSLAKISFLWKDCLYGSGIDRPLKEEVLDPFLHQKISVRNDGEMRNRSQLNYCMPKEYCDIFDAKSLTQEALNAKGNGVKFSVPGHESITSKGFAASVLCYHKNWDMLYCGHDGFVSIWKRN